ncbi:MAG: TetR/AcrR family transcriptional regulator [Dehalococcoidia bacterium]|nr:TetR/AcrR family transcriptional regulator [Dehalococcoidia bacterium]
MSFIGVLRTFSRNELLVSRRRKHIATCASRVFAKRGYEKTTMRDVAKACDMGIGSLYYYVGSKKELVFLILKLSVLAESDTLAERVNEFAGLSPYASLKQYIRLYLKHVDELQELYIFLNHIVLSLDKDERRIFLQAGTRNWKIFRDLLIKGKESGEFNVDDPGFTARSILATADAWALFRWAIRGQYTLEEYTNLLIDISEKMIALQPALPEDKGGSV